ncbi:MAG: CARDB domain-containing protein [Pyrinomonadaceae bacterium]
MSNTVLEKTAKSYRIGQMAAIKATDAQATLLGDEGRHDYEKTNRDHCRKASCVNHQHSPDLSRRVVLGMRDESPDGSRRRRITHRRGDAAHDLSPSRGRAASFHRIAGRLAVDLSQIAVRAINIERIIRRQRKGARKMKTRSTWALLVLTLVICLVPSIQAQTNDPATAGLPSRPTQTTGAIKRATAGPAPAKQPSGPVPSGAIQKPGTKLTEQITNLPDLVIIDSNQFTGTECTKGYAFAETQHWLQIPPPPPEDLCWGVRVRNAGRSDAAVNILQVILVGNNGDVRKIEAKVPALRPGQNVWVPVKMPWTKVQENLYGSATFVELKSLAATVDMNQQVAEVNENNNTFSKNVTGTFSGNVTDNTGGGLWGDGKYAPPNGHRYRGQVWTRACARLETLRLERQVEYQSHLLEHRSEGNLPQRNQAKRDGQSLPRRLLGYAAVGKLWQHPAVRRTSTRNHPRVQRRRELKSHRLGYNLRYHSILLQCPVSTRVRQSEQRQTLLGPGRTARRACRYQPFVWHRFQRNPQSSRSRDTTQFLGSAKLITRKLD